MTWGNAPFTWGFPGPLGRLAQRVDAAFTRRGHWFDPSSAHDTKSPNVAAKTQLAPIVLAVSIECSLAPTHTSEHCDSLHPVAQVWPWCGRNGRRSLNPWRNRRASWRQGSLWR